MFLKIEMQKIEEDSCSTLHHFCFVLFWHPSSTAENWPIQIWVYPGYTNSNRTLPINYSEIVRQIRQLPYTEADAFLDNRTFICCQNVQKSILLPDVSVTNVFGNLYLFNNLFSIFHESAMVNMRVDEWGVGQRILVRRVRRVGKYVSSWWNHLVNQSNNQSIN